MDIPDTVIIAISLAVLSLIGGTLAYIGKQIVYEMRMLHASVQKVEAHLAEAREDLFEVATVVSACPSCPHPFDTLLKHRKKEADNSEDGLVD